MAKYRIEYNPYQGKYVIKKKGIFRWRYAKKRYLYFSDRSVPVFYDSFDEAKAYIDKQIERERKNKWYTVAQFDAEAPDE